jgi:branched-subunit amino acid aminotransferase/4-amino-4-deoxychorismate lyase
MELNFFSHNWEIRDINESNISLSNIGYQYWFGVYETIKVRKDIIFFLDNHINRLLEWAKEIWLEHDFEYKNIKEYIINLKENLDEKSFNLKILLIWWQIPEINIIPLAPLFVDRKLYKKWVKTISKNYERWLPNVKSLNMLPSYLLFTEWKKQWCYDVLLKDKENNLIEWTRTNFFCLKWDKIYTPPLKKILNWVTRQTILFVAEKNNFEIIKKDINYDDISYYDGAFLTSTSSKIIPIKSIDNFEFQDICPTIGKLIKIYNEFLDTCEWKFNI